MDKLEVFPDAHILNDGIISSEFLHTEAVKPNISEKDEYLLYRNALKDRILLREELLGTDMKRALQAREKGIQLLKSKI